MLRFRPSTSDITLIDQKFKSSDQIQISVIIPVYNQSGIIIENLESLLSSMSQTFQIVFLDDSSEDNSLNLAKDFIQKNFMSHDLFLSYKIFQSLYSLFETFSENFLIKNSDGIYILGLQADMKIGEKDFDSKLLVALNAFEDIFLISGRGVETFSGVLDSYCSCAGSDSSYDANLIRHLSYLIIKILKRIVANIVFCFTDYFNSSDTVFDSLTELKVENNPPLSILFPTIEKFIETGCAGRLGNLINDEISTSPKNTMWVGETVMRGPLFFSKKKYFEFGGFDCNSFFLGYDDHEISLRVWLTYFHRVAFVPINFSSPLANGTTRKPRSFRTEFLIYLNLIRINSNRKSTLLYKYRLSKKFQLPVREIRYY
jgi:GT2 family glycosyltransferase